MVRFRVTVVGGIGVSFYFLQSNRGGGVEEVADAFLTFVCDGVGGHFFGCVWEGLC